MHKLWIVLWITCLSTAFCGQKSVKRYTFSSLYTYPQGTCAKVLSDRLMREGGEVMEERLQAAES